MVRVKVMLEMDFFFDFGNYLLLVGTLKIGLVKSAKIVFGQSVGMIPGFMLGRNTKQNPRLHSRA